MAFVEMMAPAITGTLFSNERRHSPFWTGLDGFVMRALLEKRLAGRTVARSEGSRHVHPLEKTGGTTPLAKRFFHWLRLKPSPEIKVCVLPAVLARLSRLSSQSSLSGSPAASSRFHGPMQKLSLCHGPTPKSKVSHRSTIHGQWRFCLMAAC